MTRFRPINRELVLLLGMLAIAALLNFLVASNRMVLGFYALPTLYSAYYYGRRHATLTAFASFFLVIFIVYWKARTTAGALVVNPLTLEEWFDLAVWGGILVVTAYAMGTLYERQKNYVKELRETYEGLLLLLRQFVSHDLYIQNHSYRVSIYASRIGAELGLDPERVEDVRTAALLHDIGVLDISRELLFKAARMTKEEFERMKDEVLKGSGRTQPVGGSLRRVLPIIIGYHEKLDQSGGRLPLTEDIPIEARIISLAKAYDALTSARPDHKPLSPFEAREAILKGRGVEYDHEVVDAFLEAFNRGEMTLPAEAA